MTEASRIDSNSISKPEVLQYLFQESDSKSKSLLLFSSISTHICSFTHFINSITLSGLYIFQNSNEMHINMV